MNTDQYDLFNRTLLALGRSGVLSDLILIGGWCLYFYRILFRGADDIPVARTLDLDFLIRNPPRIRRRVDVSVLLLELGFVEEFSHLSGNSRFAHPDLEIEFIIPEKGRGMDGPRRIDAININAQGLRLVSMLEKYTMTIPFGKFNITVPEPEAFVLHKFHVSGRRTKTEKKEKDIETATELGEYLVTINEHASRLIRIYGELPAGWRKEIIGIIKEHSRVLYEVLVSQVR